MTKLDVNGNASFGSGANKSTFTATGALMLAKDAALTLSGASGNIVSASSVTASAFFGRGESVTGVTAATNANLTGDVTSVGNAATAVKASGQFTVVSTLTVQGNAFSVGGSSLAVVSGRVGIGTSTFVGTEKLRVLGGEGIRIEVSGGGSGLALFETASNNGFQVNPNAVGDVVQFDFTHPAAGTAAQFNVNGQNAFIIDSGGMMSVNQGQFNLAGQLNVDGGQGTLGSATIYGSSNLALIGGLPGSSVPSINLAAGGSITLTPDDAGKVIISGAGAPTTGGALCLNASNQLSKCTSAVDALGDCTCP